MYRHDLSRIWQSFDMGVAAEFSGYQFAQRHAEAPHQCTTASILLAASVSRERKKKVADMDSRAK
jgi:hypothetical protein